MDTPSRLARTRSLENREPMKVYLRIRPTLGGATTTDSFLRTVGETTVITAPPREGRFQFTKVLGEEANQTEVFENSARPLVSFFLRGGSGILFAHGMTGSGKTYTIHGRNGNDSEGILPRSLDLIFKSINNAKEATDSWTKAGEPLPPNTILLDRGWDYSVFVSFMEIYNENVYDLSTPTSSSNNNNSDATRESLSLKDRGENHPPLVQGLSEEVVSSVEEAHHFLERGQRNRKMAATQMNQSSSRSHSIFTIKLVRYPRGCTEEELPKKMKYCKLAIVDLAGSERASRTGAAGVRLKEASGINLSLMTFGRVLEALRNNQKASSTHFPTGTPSGTTPSRQAPTVVVPYRESKLTRLVQSYFTSGKAVMIANVSPDTVDSDETLQVLKFSAMAKELAISETPQTLMTASSSSSFASLTKSTASSSSKRRSGVKRKAEEDLSVDGEELKEIPTIASSRRGTTTASAPEGQTAMLLKQIDELKKQVLGAEKKASNMEASIREEMVRIMASKLEEQEQMHTEQMEEQLDMLEEKYERKIDILSRLQEEQERSSKGRRNRKQRGSIDQGNYSSEEEEEEEDEKSKRRKEEDMSIVTFSAAKAEAGLREAEERERVLKEKFRELEGEHQKLMDKYEVQASILEEMHQQLRGEDTSKHALVARSAQLEQNLACLQAEQAQNLSALRESLHREFKEIQTGLEAHHQSEIRNYKYKLAQGLKEKEELQLTLKANELELDQFKVNVSSSSASATPTATNKIGEKTPSWKKPNIPVLGLHDLADSTEDLSRIEKERKKVSSPFMMEEDEEEEEVLSMPLPSVPSERPLLKMTDSNPFEDVELGGKLPKKSLHFSLL
jgi:kinesin family protein 20